MAADPEVYDDCKLCLQTKLGKITLACFLVCIIVLMIPLKCDKATESEINPVDPAFRLDSATVSQLNVTGPELTATWHVKVVAVNPNHMLGISFDPVQAAMVFEGKNRTVTLATKPLPPPRQMLYQNTEATQSFRLETASAYVGDGVAKEISEGRANGSVTFLLNLSGMFKYSTYFERSFSFNFDCDGVEFRFSPPGNWTGTLATTNQSTLLCTDSRSDHPPIWCLFGIGCSFIS